MAEVAQIQPHLVDWVRERTMAASNSLRAVHPESMDLGERNRRVDGRSPFVVTCDSFARQGRFIVLWASPSTWQWTLKQRGTVQKTRAGSVVHIWRDRVRPTYYDEAEVNMTFQSGNIIPIRTLRKRSRGGVETVQESLRGSVANPAGFDSITTIPPGLLNFYEFVEMLDEPKILDTGSMNFVSIIASTPMFPQLVLKGFFNPEGVSWSESKDDPNDFEWSAQFTVTQTFPAINSGRRLRSTFEQLSGKSVIGNVLVGPTGRRLNINGTPDMSASGRASSSATDPRGATDTQRYHPPGGVNPTGGRAQDVAWRNSAVNSGRISADNPLGDLRPGQTVDDLPLP
jgi:hypothetical protein